MKEKNPEILNKYKSLGNEISDEIRRNKYHHLKLKFEKSKKNIKKFWININTLLGRTKKGTIPSTMFINYKKLSGKHNIAQNFNKHFSGVAPNLLRKIPKAKSSKVLMPNNSSNFFFNATTPL